MNWTLLIAITGALVSLGLAANNIYDSARKRRRERSEIKIQEEAAADTQSVNQINATLEAMRLLNENLDERHRDLVIEHRLLVAQNNVLMRRDLVRERRENILRTLIEDKLGEAYPRLPEIPKLPDLDSLREEVSHTLP